MPIPAALLAVPVLLALAASAAAAGQILPPVDPPRPAPDFALRDLSGKTHRLSDYRGQPVVVNFWATWCVPCRKEMPSLDRARAATEEAGVVVLAIDIGEEAPAVRSFAREVPVGFPLLLDPEQKVMEQWQVLGLPTTVVVDPAGRMVHKVTGEREWDDPAIVERLRELAASPGRAAGRTAGGTWRSADSGR